MEVSNLIEIFTDILLLNILLRINSNKYISWVILLRSVFSAAVHRQYILSKTKVGVVFAQESILPKWHFTKSKFLLFLSLVSYWTSIPYWQSCHAKHLEPGDHLAPGFLDTEPTVSVVMEIACLHEFSHSLGAWFTKLSYRLGCSLSAHPHFFSTGRKGSETGIAWNMKVMY